MWKLLSHVWGFHTVLVTIFVSLYIRIYICLWLSNFQQIGCSAQTEGQHSHMQSSCYPVWLGTATAIIDLHVIERCRRKEERSKQARSNKQQGKTTQHTQGSHFSFELSRVGIKPTDNARQMHTPKTASDFHAHKKLSFLGQDSNPRNPTIYTDSL